MAGLLIAGGCARGEPAASGDAVAGDETLLRPSFEPLPGGAAGGGAGTAPSDAGVTETTAGGLPGTAPDARAPEGVTTSAPPNPRDAPPASPDAARDESWSGVEDPSGDRTPTLDQPPPWSDLIGAGLLRSGEEITLRVRLAGGAAPATAPTEDHSMNIASFYDVDGDGRVDYEIWLNLADDGWYPAYFRPRGEGPNLFGDASGVMTSVTGDEVVARFPRSHLASSATFRWSVASEWGRHEVLGTPAAARDDVPDDDRSVSST